jgi:hypothetical protein
MLREILDSHQAELADFREALNFRRAKRIVSVAVPVVRAITLLENRKLPGLSGEGWASGFGVFAALCAVLI